MLLKYLIKRTDLKKSLYVNKVHFFLLFIHELLVFSFNDNKWQFNGNKCPTSSVNLNSVPLYFKNVFKRK